MNIAGERERRRYISTKENREYRTQTIENDGETERDTDTEREDIY